MNCLICKKETSFIAHALIAPWLSKLFGGGGIIPSKLYHCQSCNFKFFDYRYSTKEVTQIYSGYRSGNYRKLRKRWEPWYTSTINDLYTSENSSEAISKRKQRMINQFELAGVDMHFENCLDFGGDDGQFFPDQVTGSRFLIDPSSSINSVHRDGIRTVPNIESIREDLGLIMCCMVLEHLSELDQVVSEVSKKLDPKNSSQGGILYLEIPRDGFQVGNWAKSKLYLYYLFLLVKIPPLYVVIDFLTGVSRNYFHKIPLFGIVKQSEHINYFSSQAIRQLIEKEYEIIYVSEENITEKYGYFRLGFLAAIARKK